MFNRALTVVFLLAIMGMLIQQRFSLPPELVVRIAAAEGQNAYGFGESLRRGSIIETGDGYLEVAIGNGQEPREAQTHLWLSKKTTIVIDRLTQSDLTVRLTRGRIVASISAEYPLRINTNATKFLIYKATASFVNFDFLETIQAIPIEGTIQTTIKGTTEHLLTPLPLSIHETDPVTYERLEANLATSDAKDFYQWAGVLTPP